MSKKEIFISHRSIDKEVVKELVQFLENVGINSDKIMYTSADYTNAKKELASEIKSALKEASVYIVILSKEYFESVYCCNELGYIWATEKILIIFGLEGINSTKDMQGFVNDWVIRRVNNINHVAELYDRVQIFSNIDYITDAKLTEYKNRYLGRINEMLEKRATTRKQKPQEIYRPDKIIDIDSLIQSSYYGDKELLLFKYLIETNDYIWGITKNLKSAIQNWEKKCRLQPFLSSNLEPFLVMLTHKGYVNCKIISRKEWALQDAVDKTDSWSKIQMALYGANEKGETQHNYFEIKEPLYRAIIMCNQESRKIIDNCAQKYKLKFYQKYKKD